MPKPRWIHDGPWRSLPARTHHTPRPCHRQGLAYQTTVFPIHPELRTMPSENANCLPRSAVRRLTPSCHQFTRPAETDRCSSAAARSVQQQFSSNGNISRKVRTLDPGPRVNYIPTRGGEICYATNEEAPARYVEQIAWA